MKKVLVSVINNLSTDQRVEKVCATLAKEGYEISVIGTNLYGLPELKRPYQTERFALSFQKSFLLFAEFNLKLLFKLLFKADKNTILLANDLDSLLPNYWISKIKKIPLVFDSHEIYSELPSVQGKFSQKIWRKLEKYLLPKMKYFYTVSDGYSNFFETKYGVKPQIINNSPNYYYKKNKESEEKIIIYQGVLEEGRGLKYLIQAMKYLPEFQLYIIGYGSYKQKLEFLVQEQKLKNIVFLGRKSPAELRELTCKASLGVSIEENIGLSYYYALPNKLFDYIHSGIPIVGSFLPEIKKIISENEIGETISEHNPKEIAEKIRKVSANGKEFYQDNLQKAAQKYCWENQSGILLEIYLRASNEHK